MIGSPIDCIFYESTLGYKDLILKRVESEAVALDRFFQLLDEYRRREAHPIAELNGYQGYYKTQKTVKGILEETVHSFPNNLELIAYTDDPGFFVASNENGASFPGSGFCASLKSFQLRFKSESRPNKNPGP